jgi:hypothetical protein
MYGGLFAMVLVSLILLSPVIWFAWWMLADLGQPGGRPHHAA